jgi:hypothetical protein
MDLSNQQAINTCLQSFRWFSMPKIGGDINTLNIEGAKCRVYLAEKNLKALQTKNNKLKKGVTERGLIHALQDCAESTRHLFSLSK